jgi:signal recognition particle subunit SRP54
LLVACDVYRPAAIKQLQVVGSQVGVDVFEKGQIDPVQIAKEAVAHAKYYGFDPVILDTAGRLHIDEKLMEELRNVRDTVKPQEILLVVDSMTGQDAVNVSETFNKNLGVDGVILTKLAATREAARRSPSRRSPESPSNSAAQAKSSPTSSRSTRTAWPPAYWAWETF